LKSKGNSPYWSDIRKVFIAEFPEFKHEFEMLSSHEDFTEMLTDYRICQMELEKLSSLHGDEEMYLQLESELKEEILNYIINHIKVINKN
jgi:hypothetical protein